MSNKSSKPGFLSRLNRALGPLAAGLLLDFADLATFGPIGIVAGFFVGITVALWICSIYRFPLRTKVIMALLAGLYCMVPMTELLPLATLVAAGCRFFEQPPSEPPAQSASRKKVASTVIEEDENTG